MLAVAGVLRPSGGKVLLGDADLTRARPEQIRAAGVAVVPEGRRLLPELTVEDNLRVATYALSREERTERHRVRARALPASSRRAGRRRRALLSGGEQQMVVLAQALVSRPKFLLVDELSLGLAPDRREEPRAHARGGRRAPGVGVLLIEQFAHVALGARQHRLRPRGRPHPLPRARRRSCKSQPDLLHSAYLMRSADCPDGDEAAE